VLDTGALLPVVTLVIGYLLKSSSDWVQHRRTLNRDRETRQADRSAQLAERRTDFQRQTLLDLQEAVMDVARTTGAMHHHDQMGYRNTGQWQRALYPADLDAAAAAAMRHTSILMVRVRDVFVRELVRRFREHSARVTTRASKEVSESELAEMATVFEELQHRIGELLRQIDDET
jgi:hypothetical protein